MHLYVCFNQTCSQIFRCDLSFSHIDPGIDHQDKMWIVPSLFRSLKTTPLFQFSSFIIWNIYKQSLASRLSDPFLEGSTWGRLCQSSMTPPHAVPTVNHNWTDTFSGRVTETGEPEADPPSWQLDPADCLPRGPGPGPLKVYTDDTESRHCITQSTNTHCTHIYHG